MRRVTISFAPGGDGFFGAGVAGLVVADLKAASAVFHGSPADRVLLGGFVIAQLLPRLHRHKMAYSEKGIEASEPTNKEPLGVIVTIVRAKV